MTREIQKCLFLLYTAYISKKYVELCYEKITKFENVLKMGPEPIFFIFYGMKMDEKLILNTNLIEIISTNKVL